MPVGIWQTDHVNASAPNPKSPRERRRLVGILGNADVPVGTLLGTPTSRRHPGECRRPRRHGEWKANEKPTHRLAVASFTGRRDVGAPRCRRRRRRSRRRRRFQEALPGGAPRGALPDVIAKENF
jgi:hypothetical protein